MDATIFVAESHQILPVILDNLVRRFITVVPDDERQNLMKIGFQIELAYWFYLDFFCSDEYKRSRSFGIKEFAAQIFQHVQFLRVHLSAIDQILEDWKEYKLAVSKYGAILVSAGLNYVLLV